MENSPGSKERRRSRRLPVIAKVRWEESGESRYCYTKDISQHGAFIVSNELVPIGEILGIEMAIPHSGQTLQVRGRVVRHEKGDTFTGRERGFAIDFIEIGPAAKEMIKGLEQNYL